MQAARQNDGFLCFLLLSRGAQLDARNRTGQTALRLAFDSESRQAAQDLLRYHARWDPSERDALLVGASGCGMNDFVRELLDRGADVNSRDGVGSSALMRALLRDHGDTANLLLQHGADITVRNVFGGTALLAASGGSHPEIVQTLLARGADPRVKRTDGFTPLMFAAARGNLRISELLLSQGAEVNAKNSDGYTPLSLARLMQSRWESFRQERTSNNLYTQDRRMYRRERPPGERKYVETVERLKRAGAVEEPPKSG
jgi:ankyrin repeat protein